MKNQWRAVWNQRTSSNDRLTGRWQDVLLELKRANGYDVMEGGLPLETFIGQDKQMRELLHLSPGKSVFEVGCGAGANLYLMQRDSIMVGGMDYSPPLVDTARTVLPDALELSCGEADKLSTERTYDAVFSAGVFSYFTGTDYARRVLTRMLEKSRGALGLLEVHDIEKEDAYHAFRRASIPDYDERYKGLDKLFYPRAFFEDFARKHDLTVTFPTVDMPGYWNTPFIFNCFMYRK